MKKIGGKTPINETLVLNYNDTVDAQGGKGNDIYIISDNQKKSATIKDTLGKNIIVLENNTHILSSKLSKDLLKITLENKAVISINNASNFEFKLGSESLETLKLTDFSKKIGTGKFEVNPTETQNLDKLGNDKDAKIIDAVNKAMTFEISPMNSRAYVEINHFGKDDILKVKDVTKEQFEKKAMISSDELGNVQIIFNALDKGELYKIKLLGVATPNDMIFDLNTFNLLPVGDIVF